MGRKPVSADQLALTASPRVRKGRAERAVDADVTAARAAGTLADTAAGLVASARITARQLDVAERTDQPYAVRQLSSELRELYRALGLAGADETDAFAAFAAALGGAVVPDDTP